MDAFAGKTAVVTGGASGIGCALTEELCRRGALATLADVNEALLGEVVDALTGEGYDVRGASLDVTDLAAVKEVVDGVVSRHGRLDYMFNNAGIVVAGETQDFSHSDWHRVIDTNLYGVVHGVMAAYPVMVRQRSGHIVNTASLAGLVPATGEISYTASKYGVVGLSHSLRAEGAHYGVKVSVVCPGFVRTPIYESCELIGLDREKMTELAPEGMSPRKCARAILRGVERNRATIVVTPLARAFWVMQRLSPALVRAIFSQGLMKPMREAKDG